VEDIHAGRVPWQELKGAVATTFQQKMRVALLLGGVDSVGWPGGLVSSVHSAEDVDRTLVAFDKAHTMLADEGEL
jgi:glutamate-1-semialdehyde 2,1-aminomutase